MQKVSKLHLKNIIHKLIHETEQPHSYREEMIRACVKTAVDEGMDKKEAHECIVLVADHNLKEMREKAYAIEKDIDMLVRLKQ